MSDDTSFPSDGSQIDGFAEDHPFDGQGLAELSRLLENDAVWAEPSPDLEDRLLASIAVEREKQPSTGSLGAGQTLVRQPEDQTATEPVIDLEERRARRTGNRRFRSLLAAAAVLIIAGSGAAGFVLSRTDTTDYTVALAPTELAPAAGAVARIDDEPNGARLIIDLAGLDPAPAGSIYEVWLVKEEPRITVSAGTFHMRGDEDAELEFWAGVSPEDYPIVTVTLGSETDPSAPNELILRGEVDVG